MKTIKKDNSLYRAVLNRCDRRSKQIMDLESQIDRYLQKFVYLINKYCCLHFENDPIPSDIVSFRDEIEIIIGVPKRKYSFQLDEETESVVIADLMSLHMFLTMKG
ncbi:hypothetical protein HA402_003002 [Bradysia odoriphaga]|nr:hypothetical protein HA402_003002 [Bradysia odoriphaga]